MGDNLGKSGIIWDHQGRHVGSSWIISDHLGSSAIIWAHLGSSGIIWDHLASSGIILGTGGL